MYNMGYRNKFGIFEFVCVCVGGGGIPSPTYNFEFLWDSPR